MGEPQSSEMVDPIWVFQLIRLIMAKSPMIEYTFKLDVKVGANMALCWAYACTWWCYHWGMGVACRVAQM